MKLCLFGLFACLFSVAVYSDATSIFAFKVNDITGTEVNLSDYKGKVLLIVNTASKCGFTKQYTDLVKLQKDYADKNLVVLGFPANNFGGQEPGSNEQIAEFCSASYGVDFPMFAKVSVKGKDQVPLFQYLTKAENKDFTGDIRWNFEKFLVDENGVLQRRFRSTSNPSSKVFRKALDEMLASQTEAAE